MTSYSTDRTALFIDGANLYSSAKALNADLDFRKLVEKHRAESRLIRAYYYTAIVEGEEFSPIKPLIDCVARQPRTGGADRSLSRWERA